MKHKINAAGQNSATFVLAVSLPLVAVLFFYVFPDLAVISRARLQLVLIGYCVGLLGFFSGVRFGALVNGSGFSSAWIVPFAAGPVFGIAVLLMPFSLALAVLAAGFGAHGAWDSWAAFRGRLPAGYSARRIVSTIVTCLLLIVIFIIDGLQ